MNRDEILSDQEAQFIMACDLLRALIVTRAREQDAIYAPWGGYFNKPRTVFTVQKTGIC